MEVVNEVTNDVPVVNKDWSEVLREEIAKSDRIANRIKSQVLMPHFTIEKMQSLMVVSYGEAQKMITDIARFGYLETKDINGVKHFMIVADPLKRIEQIKGAIANIRQNAEMQITQYTAMCEITLSYVPAEAEIVP